MSVFLSYARGDDGIPYDPHTSFAARLHRDLTAAGFDVWFDREDMPSRNLSFHQEIRDAIASHDRLLLVVGPRAVTSNYVRQEWQFAWFEAEKVVSPILRKGDFPLVPDELKLLHCEDFREDKQYSYHLQQLIRILRDPAPPLGKLIAVPSLPAHFLSRPEGLVPLRDALRTDLDRPVVISGAAAKVGLHGMGGIGKSVLAAALSHDRKIREAFPDGIVWIGLGALPDLRALMQRVHLDLGGDGAIATEHEGTVKLTEILADKAVLLVLDDVWRRSDIDSFDVLGPRCRALITTRDTGLLANAGKHYIVDLFTDQEARRLLAQTLECETDDLPGASAELISECGRLPLAMALAGGMIKAGMPWSDLIAALREHELEFLENEHSAVPQHRNLWRMIEVSVKALPEETQIRLAELAVFPPDESVPAAAIATLWGHSAKLSPRDSRKLLITLKQRSLVQIAYPTDEQAEDIGRVSLHDLIHDFAARVARQLIGTEQVVHTRLLDAYRNQCPGGWWNGPNDGYLLTHVRDHLLASDRGGQLADLLMELRWFEAKNAAGLVFDLSHDFSSAIKTLPASDDRVQVLSKLQEALHRDIHFIHRHRIDYPQGLFQSIWNLCRSFDSPIGLLTEQTSISADEATKTQENHLSLSALMQRWRLQQRTERASFWVASQLPPYTPKGSPLTLVLPEQGEPISTIRFTLDGCRVITCGGESRQIRFWDVGTGECDSTISTWSSVFAISADARRIAGVEYDGMILSWNSDTLEQCGRFCFVAKLAWARSDFARCLALNTDGSVLAAGYEDGIVVVWFGNERARIVAWLNGPIEHLAFGSSSELLAIHAGNGTGCVDIGKGLDIVANEDPTVFVYDAFALSDLWRKQASNSSKPQWMKQNTGTLLNLDMSANGEWLALAASIPESVGVQVPQVFLRHLKNTKPSQQLIGHERSANAVCFSDDGQVLASASSDGTVRTWDVNTGKESASFRGPHPGSFVSVAISPAKDRVAASLENGSVCLWSTIAKSASSGVSRRPQDSDIRSVVYSPDGRLIATGASDLIARVFDATDAMEFQSFHGHKSMYHSTYLVVRFHPDGKRLITAAHDGTVRLWNIATGKEILCIRNRAQVQDVAVSPDGSRLAVVSDRYPAAVFNSETGEELFELKRIGLAGAPLSVKYADDGSQIVVRTTGVSRGIQDQTKGPNAAINDATTGTLLTLLHCEDSEFNRRFGGNSGDHYRAFSDESETIIKDNVSGKPIARYSVPLMNIAKHPTLPKWAGSIGRYLYIIALESLETPATKC